MAALWDKWTLAARSQCRNWWFLAYREGSNHPSRVYVEAIGRESGVSGDGAEDDIEKGGVEGSMNWQAIAAVATFCAVLLALYPIWQGEIRRRAQASNLRFRLLIQLTLLRPMIARRFQDTELGPQTSTGLIEEEAQAVGVLEAFLAQAHILNPKEHDLVATAVTNLILSRPVQRLEPNTARNILASIDQARDELEKGKFLRWKFPKLPWN